jgi:NAD(P)-dependent dehydrogenase (short-subunit alcohol dehydrogenase family)
LQSKLDPQPKVDELPTPEGGAELYKAAGKLKGKKAIITGGDSGIGRSIAVLYAMEGADSFIAYLPQEEEDAQETKRLVEEKGQKCYTLALDLTDRANCKKVIDEAVKQMGGIDILVNNHAYQMMVEDIKDLSEDQWVHTFNTNIHPFFYLSKYALPHMKKGSTIINNASINAYIGRPDLLDYTSTKGAIISFTRGLSNQYVGRGIRVNAVVRTPIRIACETFTDFVHYHIGTRTCMDPSHPRYHERRRHQAVHRAHRSSVAAQRDRYLLRLLGQQRQLLHQRSNHPRQRWYHRQRLSVQLDTATLRLRSIKHLTTSRSVYYSHE